MARSAFQGHQPERRPFCPECCALSGDCRQRIEKEDGEKGKGEEDQLTFHGEC
jgi:hypothetical protein